MPTHRLTQDQIEQLLLTGRVEFSVTVRPDESIYVPVLPPTVIEPLPDPDTGWSSLEAKVLAARRLPELDDPKAIIRWVEETPEGRWWESTQFSHVSYHALIEDHDPHKCVDRENTDEGYGLHSGCWDNSISGWHPVVPGQEIRCSPPQIEGTIVADAFDSYLAYSSDYAAQQETSCLNPRD